MEKEMHHPVLTECFYGQKGGNSCETLIATMFKTWLEAGSTESRVQAVKEALTGKGIEFSGRSTYEGHKNQRL